MTEGCETYTFHTEAAREAYRAGHTREKCGVEFEFIETEETFHTFRLLYLHTKRITPTTKKLLMKGAVA
jgi:hypothetical protein